MPSKALGGSRKGSAQAFHYRLGSYNDAEDGEGGVSSTGTQGYRQHWRANQSPPAVSAIPTLLTWSQVTPAGSALPAGRGTMSNAWPAGPAHYLLPFSFYSMCLGVSHHLKKPSLATDT